MHHFHNHLSADRIRMLRALACSTLIALVYGCGGGGGGSPATASADTAAQEQTAAAQPEATSDDTSSAVDGAELLTESGIPGPSTIALAPPPVDEPHVQVELPADPESDVEPKAINSVQTIIDDMARLNDLQIAGMAPGYGWRRGAQVIMGASPRGNATPSYWQPSNRTYKSANWWRTIIPWFVIFDGVGNGASQTWVQIRSMKIYVQSRATRRWTLLAVSQGFGGYMYPKSMQGLSLIQGRVMHSADGSASIQPGSNNLAFHGWCCGMRDLPNPADVGAVHVTMQARIVPSPQTRINDTARARYLLHVGADYYPSRSETSISIFAPTGYNPGVGVSRAKLLTTQWQSISMTTLSVAQAQAGGQTITADQLRASPPPQD